MPKTSKWTAQHKGCQAAVDKVKADLTSDIERLREALEEIRRYTQNVAVCAEAYNETESAHLWQEVSEIADKALAASVS